MKAGPPNDFPQDARLDENDPVWRLLARAPCPEPDGWFAARTLARCRYEGPAAESGAALAARFAGMWRWALGGGLALTLAAVLAVTLVATHIYSEKADKQKKVQEAFEIMASIDTDSDSTSTSPWQDSSF